MTRNNSLWLIFLYFLGRTIFQKTLEFALNFCHILVTLPGAPQQSAAAREGTLVQASGIKTRLPCLECPVLFPPPLTNLEDSKKVILWSSGVYMGKLESSCVTIGNIKPNAMGQMTMSSPNKLWWQIWAAGSTGYSSWVCFSSYLQGTLAYYKHWYLKLWVKYLELVQTYLKETERQ